VHVLRRAFAPRTVAESDDLYPRLFGSLEAIESAIVAGYGKPVIGSMLIGSYATRTASADSDVDLHLFVDGDPDRVAMQQSKIGVRDYSVDVQITSYEALRLQLEHGTAADIVLMYARGVIVRDTTERVAELQRRALSLVEAGPPALTPNEAASMRATLAAYFQTVPKQAKNDRPGAHYNMMVCLLLVYEIEFRIRRAFKSYKPNSHLTALQRIAPELGAAFLRAADPAIRFETRLHLVNNILTDQMRRLAEIAVTKVDAEV